MNNSLYLAWVLLLIGFMSHAQDIDSHRGAYSCYLKKSTSDPTAFSGTFPESSTPHSFNVLKYSLNLNLYSCYFTPYPKSFNATNKVRFRVDSTLSSINLHATGTSLVIDSVKMAGVSFTHASNILTIQLDRTYLPGEIAEVRIFYHHLDVQDNAFYASGGMVFTDCEPEGARKWYPCWDRPSDKALLDLMAKVPSNVKLGSNGFLADSILSGDTLTYHWISNHNLATYLIVLTSKVNYNLDIVWWNKISNPNDSVPIRFYYNSGENPSASEAIIGAMTTYFSQKFCEYPFDKNGFATLNSQFPWGGMENQTLTSLCPNCWSEWLLAHEFAHQWYGDMITCATWADIWLNEGFATWCENFWWEYKLGYATYKSYVDGDANYYLSNNPGWAISVPSWATTTPSASVLFNYAITYCKGSSVLHMLRYTLGDSLYLASLQSYCTDTSLRFKSAVIGDFVSHVNSVTGNDYSWFFNQWIYLPNHPVYQNNYQFSSLGNGKWVVSFLARQMQTNPPFFRMPIEIKIVFSDASDTVIRMDHFRNNQEFNWTFIKQPATCQFDPSNDIVLKQGSTTSGTIYGKVWCGAVSSNWNESGNWVPAGVPVTEKVLIPNGVSNSPVVSDNGLSCGGITIGLQASLTNQPGKTLLVNGTLLINNH
jgi:aminopeptidase N